MVPEVWASGAVSVSMAFTHGAAVSGIPVPPAPPQNQ